MKATPNSWGTAEADVPPSYTNGLDARNSIGTTPDGKGNLGSLGLSDCSLSREGLAAAGITPGDPIPGTPFAWPSAAPGTPDNWILHGQRVRVGATGASVSFLGLSVNGPASGTAVVTYTDGTAQDVLLTLSDWECPSAAGEIAVVTLNGCNNANGTATRAGTFRIFASAPAALDTAKKVAAVVLPQSIDKGMMHIFDVAVAT